MSNKYYVPTTQEEVVLYIMDTLTIWTEEINPVTNEPFELRFNKNAPTALYSLLKISDVVYFEDGSVEYNFLPESFRIKSLGKEDIESLGFKMTESSEEFEFFRGHYYITSIDWPKVSLEMDCSIKLSNHTVTVTAYGWDDLIEGPDKTTKFNLFRGTVKNKSELKRVLTQIGVLNAG